MPSSRACLARVGHQGPGPCQISAVRPSGQDGDPKKGELGLPTGDVPGGAGLDPSGKRSPRPMRESAQDVCAGATAAGPQGFRRAYVLPDATCWAQVGFQKSSSSDRGRLRFTVNLQVTDKARWDERRRDHSPVK